MNTQTKSQGTAGHRQRMKQRFLHQESAALTDAALLELLLTYAIPQQDVRPMATALIERFGNLQGVLVADYADLLASAGIGEHTAILIKLVAVLRQAPSGMNDADGNGDNSRLQSLGSQLALFAPPSSDENTPPSATPRQPELFSNALLKEAIDVLPRLPDTSSLEEIRAFLRANLHFSAQETRQRFASYIAKRMFPLGEADHALRLWAQAFAVRVELRDACYYRFCTAEPLMLDVAHDFLLPAISQGSVERVRLRHYLSERFPSSRNIANAAQAIIGVLVAAGIATADQKTLSFSYRPLSIASFAFVLHSEFASPGIYPIADIEKNHALAAMLWNRDSFLQALYELRNMGLVSKVSEIDSVRQFTTKHTLDEVVEQLAGVGSAR